MSEAIRRLNQLDVGLERIQDPYVRDAFTALLDYVRSMVGDGVFTEGQLNGKDLVCSDGAVSTFDGVISAKGINLSDGGEVRTAVYEDILDATDSVNLPAPDGQILGVIGWAKNVNDDWQPIEYGTTTSAIYFSSTANTDQVVQLGNATNAHGSGPKDLPYRVIVFYREDR